MARTVAALKKNPHSPFPRLMKAAMQKKESGPTHTRRQLLFYKLPNQCPSVILLDGACTIDALAQYIKAEHHITSPFQLRVCVGGKQQYLKPTQRLEVVAAMGAEVVSMKYQDSPSQKRKRRNECKQHELGDADDNLSFRIFKQASGDSVSGVTVMEWRSPSVGGWRQPSTTMPKRMARQDETEARRGRNQTFVF